MNAMTPRLSEGGTMGRGAERPINQSFFLYTVQWIETPKKHLNVPSLDGYSTSDDKPLVWINSKYFLADKFKKFIVPRPV